MTLWIRLKVDKTEALGLYGDTGALDVLLHVPVDKRRFPRRFVSLKERIIRYLITDRILDPAQSSSKTEGGIPVFRIGIQSGYRVLNLMTKNRNKFTAEIFFLSKIAIYLSLRPP
jgi:hypothetical protein